MIVTIMIDKTSFTNIFMTYFVCFITYMYNNLNNNNSIPNPAAYIQKLNIFSYLLVNYSQLCQLCGGA